MIRPGAGARRPLGGRCYARDFCVPRHSSAIALDLGGLGEVGNEVVALIGLLDTREHHLRALLRTKGVWAEELKSASRIRTASVKLHALPEIRQYS